MHVYQLIFFYFWKFRSGI